MKSLSIFILGILIGYYFIPQNPKAIITTKIVYKEKPVEQKKVVQVKRSRPKDLTVTVSVPYLEQEKRDDQLLEIKGTIPNK